MIAYILLREYPLYMTRVPISNLWRIHRRRGWGVPDIAGFPTHPYFKMPINALPWFCLSTPLFLTTSKMDQIISSSSIWYDIKICNLISYHNNHKFLVWIIKSSFICILSFLVFWEYHEAKMYKDCLMENSFPSLLNNTDKIDLNPTLAQ